MRYPLVINCEGVLIEAIISTCLAEDTQERNLEFHTPSPDPLRRKRLPHLPTPSPH